MTALKAARPVHGRRMAMLADVFVDTLAKGF